MSVLVLLIFASLAVATTFLIGFIWGGLCLLFWVGLVAFLFWIQGVSENVQFPGSPVI